jgi:hypothetical protein
MTERAAVAKQWLGKHVTIPDSLQSNGPINTLLLQGTREATMEEPLEMVSDSNTDLLLGPRWVLDTNTDRSTDRRS